MNEYVFDGKSRKVGHYNDTGNVVYAHDNSGRNIGKYQPSSDTTFDKNGRRYGKGNLVTSLIMDSASD